MISVQRMEKMKRAELLSTIGAGILGAGIALLLPNILANYAIPILFLGLVAHAVGMFQMRAGQQHNNQRVWWMEALYWLCWMALIGLFIYIIVRLF